MRMFIAALMATVTLSNRTAPPQAGTLTIGTWNIEHLGTSGFVVHHRRIERVHTDGNLLRAQSMQLHEGEHRARVPREAMARSRCEPYVPLRIVRPVQMRRAKYDLLLGRLPASPTEWANNPHRWWSNRRYLIFAAWKSTWVIPFY